MKTMEEIRSEGLKALSKALSAADFIRFTQMFEKGSGDFTKERQVWADEKSVDEIAGEIQKGRPWKE